MTTEKQVNYAMFLLDKAGYSTNYMNAKFKELGAGMRERSGKVEDWLNSKSMMEISKLIRMLKEKEG